MKTTLVILAIFLVVAVSCKHQNTPTTSGDTTQDSTTFFQVNQFIQSQIDEVIKTPYYIYKIEILNDKSDSTAIDINGYKKLAASFLSQDINDIQLKPWYKESIFEDQTTESVNFNYSTTKKELPLQSVDIMLGPDGKTVKRIFMRKYTSFADSTVIEQLSWKPNERFTINRAILLNDNKETQHQTIVVWNTTNK